MASSLPSISEKLDIFEKTECDQDTVQPDELERQFDKKYNVLTEIMVSQNKSYINKLSVSKSFNLAVSLDDNSLEVYQLDKTSLSRVCRLSGHDKTVTDVVFCPRSDHLLYSSSLDGIVKLWDSRASGVCVQEYKDEGEIPKTYECMDVSQNGRVLCAGSSLVEDEAYLVFWDQRKPEPLGGYWNTHTDDITQVRFHKEKPEILVTGALDGLINVFNTMEQSEDDALTYSLNVENSVEKLTWLDGRRVACVTQSGDLQLWDADSGDLLRSYTRDKIAKAVKRSRGDCSYVVDAFTAGGRDLVLGGSSASPVVTDCVLRAAVLGDRLTPGALFSGNSQVVRCCHYDDQKDVVVTTGESGLVTVWAGAGGDAAGAGGAGGAGGHQRTGNKHGRRHKPY